MTIAEILREARELISDPERWTQGCTARDEFGRLVEPDDDGVGSAQAGTAVQWCAGGAVLLVAGDDFKRVQTILEKAAGAEKGIGPWNDEHTHADVLSAFDKAIAEAAVLEDIHER